MPLGRDQALNGACDECSRRKTRCIGAGEGEQCNFCARTRKECTFSARQSRTPLTRKNLDAVERRCRQLESALARTEHGRHVEQVRNSSSSAPTPRSASQAGVDGSPQQVVPMPTSTQCDWDEIPEHHGEADHPRDGMASLCNANDRAGYLG